MKISLSFEFDNVNEYQTTMAQMTGAAATPKATATTKKTPPPEPIVNPTPPPAPVLNADKDKVELLRGKLKALLSAKGKDAIVDVLKSVSAEKLSDVAPDKLDSLIKAIDAKLATAPAAAESLFD